MVGLVEKGSSTFLEAAEVGATRCFMFDYERGEKR